MGGYPGQTVTSNVPNPTPLQTALGIAGAGVGAYLGGLGRSGVTPFGTKQ
jgi:hypothetical protein